MRWTVVATALLAGCSWFDSKVDYKSAGQLPPLEVPPDLSAPSRDGRYVVPEPGRQSATLSGYQQEQRREKPAATAAPVLPQPENVRIERAGAERWLVVPEPPEKVWPVVREFWRERGFEIKEASPEAGVIETEWAERRANVPQGGIRGLLSRIGQSYSTAERDKFRTRLERGPDGKGTEIYISHRGMREVYTSAHPGNEAQTMWEPTEPDRLAEAENLQRLMVRFGATQERAQAAVAPPAAEERASLVKANDGTQTLQVNEPFDRAWRRVGLALDRVGFTVEDRDRQNGLYYVRYADPEAEMRSKDQSRGLLARIFGTSDPKVKPEQYRVHIRADKEMSVVHVLGKDGGAESSRTAQRILSLLHEQLK